MWCDCWRRTSVAEDRVVVISNLQLDNWAGHLNAPAGLLGIFARTWKKRGFGSFGAQYASKILTQQRCHLDVSVA